MRAEEAQQKVGPLLQSIRAALPKGWSVTYDAEYSYLEIQHDEPVVGTFYAPNMSVDDFKPKLSTYQFSFRVVNYVTPAQYQRWFTENAKTQKEADVIFADFEKRHLYGKGDKLWPKTDADKAAAARYEELIKSKRDLPDFYFQEISIRWLYGSPEMDGLQKFHVKDERIRGECSKVRERVSKLFSKYPDP